MSITTPPDWTVPSDAPPPLGDYEHAERLLPRGVAQDFIGLIEQGSMALQLGRTLRMSEATEALPVIAFQPRASFVAPMYGGRKPITEVRWTAVEIRPEEIAAIVPVPNAWIMDTQFDVEGQVERELASAMARTIDAAMLFGVDAPATYPTGGVLAFADPVTGADALAAVDAGMSSLEVQGVQPDGIAAGPAIGSALRQAYREVMAMPSEVPVPTLYGQPVRTSLTWDPEDTGVNALIGGWQYFVIGIREDITFGRSVEGVLFDENGDLVTSAWQDNVTLIKVHCRMGCAIGNPLKADGSGDRVQPFAAATW